mmetsp:Transcript_25524/g.64307  ORF Transcript_25524/g.64307 Transcript_25524/m.64307 type:complete len:203 (-) Transcript_25524:12-620(-)
MFLLHLNNLTANVLVHTDTLLFHDLVSGHLDDLFDLLGHVINVCNPLGSGDGHGLLHDLSCRLTELLPDLLVPVHDLFSGLEDSLFHVAVLLDWNHILAPEDLLLNTSIHLSLDYRHLYLLLHGDMDPLLGGVHVPARHVQAVSARGPYVDGLPHEVVLLGLGDEPGLRRHASGMPCERAHPSGSAGKRRSYKLTATHWLSP